LSLTCSSLTGTQEVKNNLLLEVIQTTYDVTRKETLIYLRVYTDGTAEAHPMRDVDFRTLALKKIQIAPSEFANLRDFLRSPKVQNLDPEYRRFWGNKDFGQTWQVTIAQGDGEKSILLVNFQPFLARTRKKPYPVEVEKLGCIVWELRAKVIGEPLERDYVGGIGGCRELGY